MKNFLKLGLLLFAPVASLYAQTDKDLNSVADSLYIAETEQKELPAKVLHAEPLYIDLIRDLGARKGEKEWNLGLGLTDNNNYDEYTALVEYEWAPIDRLGFEVELPFSFYYPVVGSTETPGNKLKSLKVATQWSFLVSEKAKTSLAIGYIHELELADFKDYKNERFITGNVYNPFFIAAKRWGQNFHTLLYTGPQFAHHFHDGAVHTYWQINSNIHYMIPGTRNFVGIEFNKVLSENVFDMTIRPQMRVGIADNLLAGIVTGIPISRENERFSTFIRLIYEPGH